jgi:hypothetical protein
MYFLTCAALVIIATVMGFAVLVMLPQAYRKEHPETILFLAPAAGMTAAAVLCYCTVLAFNGLTIVAYVPPLILGVIGSGIIWRNGLSRTTPQFILLAILTLLIAGFPFRNHLAPPDVDSQFFGLLAALMKSGAGFPRTELWPALGAEHFFSATAGSETLVAMLSSTSGIDIARSLVLICMCWIVTTVLTAWPLARTILSERPPVLAFVVLPLVLNSAYNNEYGDGSYARTAATAVTMLIAMLASTKRERAPRIYILIGLAHGATFYLHYRLFIWNTAVLAVWMAVELFIARAQLKAQIKRLALIPLASAICVLPIVARIVPQLGSYLDAHTGGAELFRQRHGLTAAFLWQHFLQFNGTAVLLFMLAGCAAALAYAIRQPQMLPKEPVRFGAAYLATMLFFCIDPLVVVVLPFTYNLLYSQSAVSSNFSAAKVIFGTVVVCAAYDLLKHATVKQRLVALGGLVVAVGALALSGLFVAVDRFAPEIGRKAVIYLPAFVAEFPNVNRISIIYSAIALSAASLTIIAGFGLVRSIRFPTVVCFGLALIIFSHEMRHTPYVPARLDSSEREAYLWLRDNTVVADTLVLSPPVLELHFWTSEMLDRNASRYFAAGERPQIFSLDWLTVVAERAAIFSRGTFLMFFTGTFLTLRGSNPDFESLDWAYWNSDRPEGMAILDRYRISHLYVPATLARRMGRDLVANPNLELVHKSPVMPAEGASNEIYRVRHERATR